MTSKPRPDSYRRRFGLTCHPLPKDAGGKTFFDQTRGYVSLERYFQDLLDEPGLGVLTADAGVGKTAAIRNLCARLPRPDFLVLYLCDTAVSPFDLYRGLALELGVHASHRRAQLWYDLKRAITQLVDEKHTSPLLVIDEAQHLSERFLLDLSGFLNFAFDSRELITVWLVGLPAIARRLQMQVHAPLRTRLAAQVHLESLNRCDFGAMIDHGLKAAGATQKLLADAALEMLFRASHGVPRQASRLLRAALREAHQRNQNLVDESCMEAAREALEPPTEKQT